MPAITDHYLRSGHTIIEGTRIGLHHVARLLQNGETIDSLIARCFSPP